VGGLKRGFENLLKGDIEQLKSYIVEKINEISSKNFDVVTEYMKYFQKKMNRMI
jgi:hypothetical protein